MLTGKEIHKMVLEGRITIEPFSEKQLNPNSYNFRLGDKIKVVVPNFTVYLDEQNGHSKQNYINTSMPSEVKEVELNEKGFFILYPGRTYLALTKEVVGSNEFVPELHGRSTTGRHGLAVNVTAGFGDLGFISNWVLEMVNHNGYPLLVKPGVQIGQFAFYRPEGEIKLYDSTYKNQFDILPAKALK